MEQSIEAEQDPIELPQANKDSYHERQLRQQDLLIAAPMH